MKRLALITLTIVATLFGIVLIGTFLPAIELFAGSLALSAALRPLVRRMEDRKIGLGWAILLWYLLIILIVGVTIALFAIGISSDITQAIEQFPAWYSSLQTQLAAGGAVGQAIGNVLPNLTSGSAANNSISLIGGSALGAVGGAVGQIVVLLAMLSLGYYWLVEATHFERLWLSLMPVNTRIRARHIWRSAEIAVGAYIRSTFVSVVLSGLVLLGTYWLLGVVPMLGGPIPFAATLALFGGLSQIVPRIGPAFAVLISVAVAAAVSLPMAVIVFVIGLVVHIAAHRLITRMVDTSSGRINPLLQVLLLLALAELGGLVAMIFAPPLAALIQVLYNNVREIGIGRQSDARALASLTERLAQLELRADPENKEFLSALSRSRTLVLQASELLDDDAEQQTQGAQVAA